MQQFIGTSLKTRLYLLVLLAFIPLVAMIFFIAEAQKTMETQAILQQTLTLVRAAANEEKQQQEACVDLLSALNDAYLMQGHTKRLSILLANLLRQSKGYADFGILDASGRLLAGGGFAETARGYSDEPWFLACLRNKHLVMGKYRGERVNGEPVLYFALPALDSRREILAVSFAALNLNWMNRTVFKRMTELPKGSRMTFLDQTQGMLSYDVDSGRWFVPQDFSPVLRSEILSRHLGTLSAPDEHRELRIYAFAPLESTFRDRPVSVVLEIPQTVALAVSKRTFQHNVALLAISALMAMLAIWWAGNVFVIRRVQAMVSASRKLAAGDLDARIGKIGVADELSHLAGVFDDMAASLQVRIEREKKVSASLEQSREQLRKLAAHQQEVREQERIRIAREIHDQFGQSLSILKMDLFWLKKHLPEKAPTVEQKMGLMIQVIDEAMKNLHAVTAQLRPVILDDFGLAAAIQWQVEEFQDHSAIACRMESSDFEPDLPKDLATAVFRVFQEILTNIIRHAQASEVMVRFEGRPNGLMLQVQDNGRGITEAEINDPSAFGLLGIRERLYPFNGRVSFEGQPGQGTRVTVMVPMASKGELQ
jgi:signal transduction histidine kinase